MELFDKKFVHFMWDDKLKGKRGFLSSGIDTLIKMVNEDSDRTAIQKGCERDLPFCKHITVECRLAYYDPNYEAKKAFYEGKKVQVKSPDYFSDWLDCDKPLWNKECQYRIKPKEEKWIAFLAMPNGNGCYLTACAEDTWNEVKQIFGAKTKLFVGTKSEVETWYKSREKFKDLIKVWEDGKTIQYRKTSQNRWIDCDPLWCVDFEYRVKPDYPCEDGIDSKACVGCEHSEDGKKEYRPYESSVEMIADFIDRFNVNCLSYCKPLIWVRLKVDKRERLIVAYGDNFVEIGNKAKVVTLQHLFKQYEFLNGSPVGIEVKE